MLDLCHRLTPEMSKMRSILAVLLIIQSGTAWASPGFGVRQVPGAASPMDGSGAFGFMRIDQLESGSSNVEGAPQIGAKWGRITSTLRSPQHNRRVGGVHNSYHLTGRAIDIVRRPGVRHAASPQPSALPAITSLNLSTRAITAILPSAGATRWPSLQRRSHPALGRSGKPS